MPRSLSALEAKLILYLEWEERRIVTIRDAMDILDCSYDVARWLVHGLVRDGWLAPITRGKYELIPASRGERGFPDTDPLFIGSTLVRPYYFSYATAAFFHGLSTQASATVYVATTTSTRRRLVTVRGKEYRIVRQPSHRFFGAVEVEGYGTPVMMARPEKTIVDSLDRPGYVGDLPEIAAMLWRARSAMDWGLVADYALRFRSYSLVQRLGYLVDLLGIRVGVEARQRVLSGVGRAKCYLGRRARWDTGGEYDSTWRIVDNVPRDELLAEMAVV